VGSAEAGITPVLEWLEMAWNQAWVDSVSLGKWVHDQRQLCMNGKRGNGASITAERIALLEAIGFESDNDNEADEWQRQFAQLLF
jgi:hypothetical protein